MLTLLGSPRRCCDGVTRRETLKAGALTALRGFGLHEWRQLAAAEKLGDGPAKNVIVLFLLGGAATQDMVDLKPHAPSEVRSQFRPIPTNVPGIEFCEHLPLLAQHADKLAVVRSVTHQAGCHNCLPCYTGWDLVPPDQHPRDSDPPSMGSVCEYLHHQTSLPHGGGRPEAADVPQYVYMPCWLGWGQSFRRAGPYGGFLGKRYDPLTTTCQPYYDKDGAAPRPGNPQIVRGVPLLEGSQFPPGITVDRLQRRQALLDQIDEGRRRLESQLSAAQYSRQQAQAFDLLTSSRLRTAFDLEREDPRTVERYGRTLFGQSTLIARRLIEQGVKFVNVTWDLFWGPVNIDYDAWDTHNNNFAILKNNKLPGFDQTFSALLEDLQQRGLLDETLVLVTSEMGRTPRINNNSGRDHWTFCYSNLLAGGGIRGGTVYGASDSQAAFVQEDPVRPADICATVYHCLGIDPELRLLDRTARPVEIAHGGRPISAILTN
uniref:DUF1501 domain-containing protein n=1 Tax=Schlesneria paludicola TaxID=360056 RepID=A0A7C4LKQ4_9PLAN